MIQDPEGGGASAILRDFQIDNCRVCIDIKDWRRRAQKAAFSTTDSPSSESTSTLPNHAELESNREIKVVTSNVLTIKPPPPLPCPPDALGLGRATWTFLHTLSVYYPQTPSTHDQEEMKTFMRLFAKFYPCGYCASHLREEMTKDPPDVTSQSAFAAWMCRMHNEVNVRLGKPVFDCSRVIERWLDGPVDGSYNCDEFVE